MASWHLVLGPPGCGKSFALLDRFDQELAAGLSGTDIAFVTYTRAAKAEVLARVRARGLTAEDVPWLRTIHSTAYRLLGLRTSELMRGAHWSEFASRYGYEFSRMITTLDEQIDVPQRTDDDRRRFVYEWGRNRMLTIEQAIHRIGAPGVEDTLRFVERLTAFKREKAVLDFGDLLDYALKTDRRPDVAVAFIDEAQDLPPIQIALVEKWFADCDRVHVAADDDQAIYTWMGAEPDWVLGLARQHGATILGQSYRVPRAAHALAQAIIRYNKNRVPKEYRPTDREGSVQRLDLLAAVDAIDLQRDTFVLARNRMFLQAAADRLYVKRIPYVVEGSGARSPLAAPTLVKAVRTAAQLAAGQAVEADGLRALVEYVPTRGADLLPHGAKAHLKKLKGQYAPMTIRHILGLGNLLDAIMAAGPCSVLRKVKLEDRMYLKAMLDRFGTIPEPRVILTSVHGAKGREADAVLVLADHTYRTHDAYLNGGLEEANRLFYVATTRTRDRLVLIRPTSARFYPFPRLHEAT